MRSKIIYLIIIVFISANVLRSQIHKDDLSHLLEKLYSRLENNYDDVNCLHINDSIRLLIERYVTSDSVFTHRLTNLRRLGQITSSDSLIKIINWNLILHSNPGRYYCYLIKKQGRDNIVYRLTSAYQEDPAKTDTVFTDLNWYGAMYYDIKPIVLTDKRCWILLGVDYGNPLISRKIIDVLTFTPENSIVFGKKWFVSGADVKFRDVFEYASQGMMSLRFTSDSLIVFDHLVPFSDALKNNRQYYGTDFSYDAYCFRNGSWILKRNVDARNK